MFNVNCDDESVCRMCLDAPAKPSSVFCAACDRKPAIEGLPVGHAPVVLRDEQGCVIFEAIVDTTGDCNAQVKTMFQALAKAGHPLIKMTVFGED
jgi:hypothetical protein